MVIGLASLRRERRRRGDGDPGCVGRDLVGGGVDDFEVVF